MQKVPLISKLWMFFGDTGESTGHTKPGQLSFRLVWIAFMVCATSAPYIVNWLNTPSAYYYTWWLPYEAQDQFGYMAWARQAAEGAILFKIKYTALPQTPVLFHPFFLICGWLSAVLHWDLGLTFFAVKALGVVVLFTTLYRYFDFLRLGRTAFVMASILVGTSAGFAEIFWFFGMSPDLASFPKDLDWPEMSTYWSLLGNPLFPFSLTLMTLTIYWAEKGTKIGSASCFWASGAATGIEALTHPYPVPLLFVWVASVTLIRWGWRALPYLARYFAAALPCAAYIFLIAHFSPIVARHGSRGQMESSTLIAYLSGFGLPLVLAVFGLLTDRGRMKQYWQIVAWFVLSIALAYSPVWFQRKLIFGSHIPICILASLSLETLYSKPSRSRVGRMITAGILLLTLILASTSSVRVLAIQFRPDATNPQNGSFIPQDRMQGVEFLKRNSTPDDIVFADFLTSRYIPAYSGNTVVWGHWAMAVDVEERQQWATRIFDPESGWDSLKRLQEFYGSGIRFIFLDEQLKSRLEQHPVTMQLVLGASEMIFENRSVSIYRARDATSSHGELNFP